MDMNRSPPPTRLILAIRLRPYLGLPRLVRIQLRIRERLRHLVVRPVLGHQVFRIMDHPRLIRPMDRVRRMRTYPGLLSWLPGTRLLLPVLLSRE